jgi:tripeptidyl-peptidase-1
MAGFNYEVVIGGSTYLVSGTSASSPVVAGMATLVNSRLAEQGKPPIGFINPTVYANSAGVFNDIVTGDNKCTAAGPDGATCCSEGFNAVEGWDAATGWGSVKFDKFAEMFGASGAALV